MQAWLTLLRSVRFGLTWACGLCTAFAAPLPCPEGKRVVPEGQTGEDIQWAIRKATPGGVVMLSGSYAVRRTIMLQDDSMVCSESGAVLTWAEPERKGMMFNGYDAQRTRTQNLVMVGRGITLRGRAHVVANNLFKDIPGTANTPETFIQRYGIHTSEPTVNILIQGNRFQNIEDTGIMAYGLRKARLLDNVFINASEGMHLWTISDTLVQGNRGKGFLHMALEIQGDDLSGVRIVNNDFRDWRADTPAGHYAVSVVSGKGTVFENNIVVAAPQMGASMEIGAIDTQVLNNEFHNAAVVIERGRGTPLVKGNRLVNAHIHKDVNRVDGGSLTIEDNSIEDPPKAGINTDYWTGYDQIRLVGNTITKRLRNQQGHFQGIQLTGTNREPLYVARNTIRILGAHQDARVPVGCFSNSGVKGNMRGAILEDNTCEGEGQSLVHFMYADNVGGLEGVKVRRNTLRRVNKDVDGDCAGVQASDNQLVNVASAARSCLGPK